MKKLTIWLVGLIMAVCCVALLFLQLSYIETMIEMRKQHFEEGVRRSLYRVSYRLELDEMSRIISAELQRNRNQGAIIHRHVGDFDENVVHAHSYSVSKNGVVEYSESRVITYGEPPVKSYDAVVRPYARGKKLSISEANSISRDLIKSIYLFKHDLLDEAIYEEIFEVSKKPVESRVDFAVVEKYLKEELANNGIELPFQFDVLSSSKDTVFVSQGYRRGLTSVVYKEPLFKNDLTNRTPVLELSFPVSFMNKYIYASVKFMLPSLLFTLVMLITFVITLYMAIRHKKITQMKNDFINNMTHEFKTPISTISLAAQMLQDSSVAKSPEMFGRLSGVISSESKRLRFQVDKVLQMSMFDDKNTAALKMKELDANELVSGVINTFAVKAEQSGGHVKSSLEASDPYVYVDEMHFTNVIFNLLDNAMKYKRADVPIELEVRTWNSGGKFMISIKDNGIGIRKEHLKKIFDKFYRVNTGNVHDVKGFGLGLAYVRQIVQAHKGTIRAESEPGAGTTFVIVLPLK